MKNVNWKSLLVSVAISLGVGILAGIITSDSMQQYGAMYQPPLAPPGWLFPIVWTILYVLMGIAAYLVYESENEGKTEALKVYAAQLIVNFFWSIIFFELQAYWLAFAWLLLLWYLIYLTKKAFYDINKIAGCLLVPYLLWVTFAGYLNLAIAMNNL